jgi:hypothetical protein
MQHFTKSFSFFLILKIKIIYSFFRKQLLPIDQKAYAQDFRQRYDNEFLQVKYFN